MYENKMNILFSISTTKRHFSNWPNIIHNAQFIGCEIAGKTTFRLKILSNKCFRRGQSHSHATNRPEPRLQARRDRRHTRHSLASHTSSVLHLNITEHKVQQTLRPHWLRPNGPSPPTRFSYE